MDIVTFFLGGLARLASLAWWASWRHDNTAAYGTVGPAQGRWSQRIWGGFVAVGKLRWWATVAGTIGAFVLLVYLLP